MVSIFSKVCMTSALFMHCQLSAAVRELPPSNWSENIVNPPAIPDGSGHQVLHFGTQDYPYELPEAVDFVKKYLSKAKRLETDADLVRFASDQVTLSGAYLELGVTTGKTINFIAALNPTKTIYGFDSFKGDPGAWHRDGKVIPAGAFALKDPNKLPLVLNNVKLIQGEFDESLPYFVKNKLNGQPIAFIHVDSDLYSSSKTAFDVLGPYIKPGTIILFDELYAFTGSEEGEFKALKEFLAQSGYGVEYLAYNAMFEAVAVKIVQK